MALDKNKASAAAQKYLQRGQIDKAIREYETIVQAEPDDVRTWLKIGDLHSRNGKVALAVSTYRKVAETYQGKGFFLKAVAVYKKVLDVDPTLTEVYRTLGDVYVKLNLTAEALTQYRLVVGSYERDGRSADAMLLLEEMVELVPDDESNHLRLAEAHAKNCHDQPAIDHFKFVLSRMRKAGRHGEFIKVAERLLYLYPDESDTVRHLGQAYLATGNTKRALGWLQKLFKQDPSDSRTLALLAETFTQIGRVDKAVAVLRELGRIYEQKGDIGKQRKAIERLLELAPDDVAAQDALARLKAAHGQETEADAALLGTDTNFSAELSIEQRIRMCLSDADLLLKYGLSEHAHERVKIASTLDKNEPTIWLKMRDLCISSGDQVGQADACVAAARLLQASDANQATRLLKEALGAQPGHALALELQQSIAEPERSAQAPIQLEVPAAESEMGTPSFDDFNMDPDVELSLDDLSLDDFDDLSADSSEFELSLDGFEVEELGFEIDESRFDAAPDHDEFADLLDGPAEVVGSKWRRRRRRRLRRPSWRTRSVAIRRFDSHLRAKSTG